MFSLIERKLVRPLKALLIGGITPRQLALSMACGAVLGLFPVLGTTTALCALAAVVLKLNLPAIQLVNYLVYPVQLAMILPFIRMGQLLVRSQRTQLTLEQIVTSFRSAPAVALHQLWRLAVLGVLAWSIFAVIAFPILYRVLLHFVERLDREIRRRRRPVIVDPV